MRNTWRGWLLYAAAWIPLAFLDAIAIQQYRNLPMSIALPSGIGYVFPPAVLGILVWWLSGRVAWPTTGGLRFVALQTIAAALFTVVWHVGYVLWIATSTGLATAITISQSFVTWQLMIGLWVYGVIAGVSYALRIGRRLREEEAASARADAMRIRAELQALRGQLNPHFLFNTLHTVRALVRQNPVMAEDALMRFGDMLRYVLDVQRAAREDVTLGEELTFVHNYLALEQLRLGDRLRVVEHIDPETLDCLLPSLTLQPLIENAVKYGVSPRVSGGTIAISAAHTGDTITVDVGDDGPGAAANGGENATGLGLRAVRQRLETRYPDISDFRVTTAPGAGFTVHFAFPARTEGSSTPAPAHA